jgi:RNA polymerase sigma-70 factor (ECF subfamily)
VSTNINPPARLKLEPNLIARAQNGDADAFAVLFEAHKRRVYAVCLRMTNNIAEAEDLTQDAFIHVFRKLSTFRADSAFSTWLYRIAVNTGLMHFRRKSGRQVSIDQTRDEDTGLPKREYGRVDERLTGCIDRLTLARAINELAPRYRMIFLLHEVAGFEHKEIAQLLHCSIGNSKSQLHKAKLRMRELLAPCSVRRQIVSTAAKESRAASREVRVAMATANDGDDVPAERGATEWLGSDRVSADAEGSWEGFNPWCRRLMLDKRAEVVSAKANLQETSTQVTVSTGLLAPTKIRRVKSEYLHPSEGL